MASSTARFSTRVSAPQDISYDDATDRFARINWMEDLVVAQPFSANQTRLLTYTEWLKKSDVNLSNWDS